MPRNYVRKTTRATLYTQEDMETAIRKIIDKELTYAAASQQYGIPTSTLSDRVLKKTRMISDTLGRATVIPKEYEERLANCLRILEKWGWGLSREEVLDITQEFVNKNELNTPFKNGRPGPDWFLAFRKRHNLSIKKPQPVEYLRKKMTDPFVINEYFDILGNTLRELNLTDDPKRIWNLDETSICLDPTKTKVVGAKGEPCTRTTHGSAKENITVLTTVNAAGEKLNPLIVYKGKYMYQEWMVDNSDYDFQLAYASSKRGWMESEIFYNYMLNIIIPNLREDRPVLLLYDGHVSHVDDKVVALAVENNITVIKLPPHTSHLLQPLDLAVFKSFKAIWDKHLVQWQRQNVGVKLRKQCFAKMFADAWQQTKPEVIKNGFKKGGIYPFNAAVIPKEKFDPRAYKRWQNHISQETLKQPKALKQLCLDAMNKSCFYDDSSKSVKNSNKTYSTMQNSSASIHKDQPNFSFEELLLKKVTQQPQNKVAVKLKRVAKGAEVITKSFLERQKQIEQNNEEENKIQKKTRQIKRKQPCDATDLGKPGPSGIQKKKTPNKTTSPAQILTDQTNSNRYTTPKGKGIGKKTRTNKENLTSITVDDKDKKSNTSQSMIDLTDSNDQKNKEKTRSTRKYKSKKEDGHLKPSTTKKTVKKRKRISSIDTTDESVQMSLHSDSDLLDSLSDVVLSDCDINNIQLDPIDYEQQIEQIINEIHLMDNQTETIKKCDRAEKRGLEIKEIHQMENQTDTFNIEIPNKLDEIEERRQEVKETYQMENQTETPQKIEDEREENPENSGKKGTKVTILSSIKLTPENQAFYSTHGSLQLKLIGKDLDLFTHNPKKKFKKDVTPKTIINDKKTKTDGDMNKRHEKITELNTFKIGNTVLVRYFKRVWKYYAGVIENINYSNPKRYTISFYKTIATKTGNLCFVIPKVTDRDCVPEINIVKEIQLLQIQENPAKYTIMDDDDAIYF